MSNFVIFLCRIAKQAIIRYPVFSETKEPERYYANRIKLFIPHRNDPVKPSDYNTYEEYYFNGVVNDHKNASTKLSDFIASKAALFCKLQESSLNDAMQTDTDQSEAWADIAPNAEQMRLDLQENHETSEDVHYTPEDLPDLHPEHYASQPDKVFSLQTVNQPINDSQMMTVLEQLNEKQQQVFNYVIRWCLHKMTEPTSQPLRCFVTGGAGKFS